MDQEKETKRQAERCRALAQRIVRELTPASIQVLGGSGALAEALEKAGAQLLPENAEQGTAALLVVEDPEWVDLPALQCAQVLLVCTDASAMADCAKQLAAQGLYRDFEWKNRGKAQQTALVQALRRGSPLTAQQRALIAPERSDIITVYRELQARRWHAEDMQPLFAKLGEEHTGKTLVALTALEQVGLIAAVERGGAKFWELVPTAGKKNLADAPILKCLEE